MGSREWPEPDDAEADLHPDTGRPRRWRVYRLEDGDDARPLLHSRARPLAEATRRYDPRKVVGFGDPTSVAATLSPL